MKNNILLIITLFYIPSVAQEIENIHVEKTGDIINIYYDLVDINPNSKYNITILCSIDNNPRFAIQNVRGDVGYGVGVGRKKKAVWDIKGESNYLELSRNQNFEFFVRAEKQKPFDIPADTGNKKYFIAYHGSTIDYLGFKMGTVKNWGGYFSIRKYDSYSLSAGLIKSIPKSYFYLYSGVGIGNWAWLIDPADDALDYWSTHSAIETNAGVMVIFSKLYLEVGTSILINNRGAFPDLTFGIGYSF